MCLISMYARIMWSKVISLIWSHITSKDYSGWNHRFNRRVAKYHPNVWHIFDCFKREQLLFRQGVMKMLSGELKTRDKKTAALQNRIDNLGSSFNRGQFSLKELLEGLSLLVGMKKWRSFLFSTFAPRLHNFRSFPRIKILKWIDWHKPNTFRTRWLTRSCINATRAVRSAVSYRDFLFSNFYLSESRLLIFCFSILQVASPRFFRTNSSSRFCLSVSFPSRFNFEILRFGLLP